MEKWKELLNRLKGKFIVVTSTYVERKDNVYYVKYRKGFLIHNEL